ncbi:unnamed protein product [Ophioblennius macclurei]
MKNLLFLAALAAFCSIMDSKHSPPKVQVYSHKPGKFGDENTFICHVSGFHPPDISIELLKNSVEIPNSQQTDLSFKDDWHFLLTKSAPFTPMEGDKILCRVTHGSKVQDYAWDPSM